jgi:hypothetical protein
MGVWKANSRNAHLLEEFLAFVLLIDSSLSPPSTVPSFPAVHPLSPLICNLYVSHTFPFPFFPSPSSSPLPKSAQSERPREHTERSLRSSSSEPRPNLVGRQEDCFSRRRRRFSLRHYRHHQRRSFLVERSSWSRRRECHPARSGWTSKGRLWRYWVDEGLIGRVEGHTDERLKDRRETTALELGYSHTYTACIFTLRLDVLLSPSPNTIYASFTFDVSFTRLYRPFSLAHRLMKHYIYLQVNC